MARVLNLSPLRRDATPPQGVLVTDWRDGVPDERQIALARVHVNTTDARPDGTVRRRFWLRDGQNARAWGWVTVPVEHWLATCESGEYDVLLAARVGTSGATLVSAFVDDNGTMHPVASAG